MQKELLEEKLKDPLYAMRHSAAHVLAQAVLEMFPEAKLGVGPVIEHGFYCSNSPRFGAGRFGDFRQK
jgi:threonyl-tRNA synthetase